MTDPRAFDGRVPFPSFASVETTMYCNLQCPMCIQFQNGTTVSGPHMDLEDFRIVAEALFPFVERFQPSVSGEPLMSKGLDQMLELAERYGVRVEYNTNGTLLNDRVIARILPTLGQMVISFDGVAEETFEKMREGATLEKVKENIARVVAAVEGLPPERRPPIGLACTLMERNVRELPDLVELARDMGLDFVTVTHVTPVTREMQGQSLAQHYDLAVEWLDAAVRRAEELGMPLAIQPLGQLEATMASSEELGRHHDRPIAAADGVVGVLGPSEVHQDRLRPWPTAPPEAAEGRACHGRKAALRRRAADILEPEPGSTPRLPESIWTCDFLWRKTYVSHRGDVHTCCIPGNPVAGTLRTQGFEEIWDGPVYRAMRLGLARRDPVPICKGCQHVREVSDPGRIAELLQGRPLPQEQPGLLPPALRPVRGEADFGEPVTCTGAPTLEWEASEETEGYEVQASLDGFDNVLFSTAWHGIGVEQPRFTIPDWAWAQLPQYRPVSWRALALLPGERRAVAGGAMVRRPFP